MSETKRNKERVDQAWNKLYDRLDADGLLLSDRQNRKRLSASMLWKWGAVAAIWVGIGVFLTTTYRKVGEPVEVRALIMQENTEQSTLVTTLEDGSIVYMGGETSLQYPEHFSMDKREVSLQGNALFDVAGNRERPFLIETEEVRIEVLGTMFLYIAVRNQSFQYCEHQEVRNKYREFVLSRKGRTQDSNPQEEMEYQELRHLIDATLARMPERRLRIFRMHRMEGKKYAEIASQLSLSVKTVEAEMTKALKALKKEIENYIIRT